MVRTNTLKKTDEELAEEKRILMTHEIIRRLPQIATRKDKVNEALNTLQECSSKGNMYSARNKQKTAALMNSALKACDSEVDGLRRVLADIEKIRKNENKTKMKGQLRRHALMALLAQQASALPLYVCGSESYPPGGVGGIAYPDSHNLEQGETVAAFIGNNWILAEVNGATTSGKYEVKDVEDENRTLITVVRKRVIGLPSHRADPTRDPHALFPVDAIVLGLYPQTTCFYKGAVVSSPQTAIEDYTVAFEDASYAGGYSPPLPVPQRYVVNYRDIKVKRKDNEIDE